MLAPEAPAPEATDPPTSGERAIRIVRIVIAAVVALGFAFYSAVFVVFGLFLGGPLLIAGVLGLIGFLIVRWIIPTSEAQPSEDQVERWRRHGRPPGAIFDLVVLAAAIGCVVATSWPHTDWSVGQNAGLLLLATGVVWTYRLSKQSFAPVPTSPRRAVLRWSVAPAIALIALFLCGTPLPFKARWARSEPAFERAVASHRVQGGTIGSIPISHIEHRGPNTYFRYGGTEASGMMSGTNTTFAYLPGGPKAPATYGEDASVESLGDHWYLIVTWWD